ncbi:MAG: hypothetical protein JWP59_856 [Massilia sp.]|nr:hypothetical protein [Massilia sp.]
MNRLPLVLARLAGSLLLAGMCSAALAIPVMEMRAEDLVPMASEFRRELTLTPNQLSLWQRVDSRSKAILRERQARRERLQAALNSGVAMPTVELRDLNKLIDAENTAVAQEDQQLRAMWLEVNDALDDKQRQQVATMIGEQLMRVAPDGSRAAPRGAERGGKGDTGDKRGAGSRRGGMGGGINIGGAGPG